MNVEVIFLTFFPRPLLFSFVGIVAISWLLHAALFSASPLVACKVASVTASTSNLRKAYSPSVLGSRTVPRSDSPLGFCRSFLPVSCGCRSDIVDIFYHIAGCLRLIRPCRLG